MKIIKIGKNIISENSPCFIIAEIGHNHQGNVDTAMKMIQVAAGCGVQAVKFQKRDNKTLYTKAMYNKPYDNENSYGATYGEHREFLEFGMEEYKKLKKCAETNGVELMATAFDINSVDFLEKLGVASYKIASGDITNIILIEYAAKLNKPIFMSTGGATMEEIRIGYGAARKFNDNICLMHCVSGYPTDYPFLNLRMVETLKKEFPEAIIGYSGHDNGILAAVIAYMLGAKVIEKHFTLNHSWKGTDHKFSLEPEGLRKQVRDLRRIDISIGDGKKVILDFEMDARAKMGKGIYSAKKLKAGTVISMDDICFKSPANGIPPYLVNAIVGKKLTLDLDTEQPIPLDKLA
jgi:N-acetylneuraminate synthase/sialic acid synthase